MITYFIGNEKYYLLNNGQSILATEYEKLQVETAKKDELAGYLDRKAGYYDKWYRYNRADNGAAYDRGCVRAVNEGKCSDHFTIIECMEAEVKKCQLHT